MYCEIVVEHPLPIDPNVLTEKVRASFKRNDNLTVDDAYVRSAIYSKLEKNQQPTSLLAFELERDCFVILRKVGNVRFSNFHLEGNNSLVGIDTTLTAVQEFSKQLLSELGPKRPAIRATNLTARLFEDTGRETGLEGKLVTLWSVLREKFAWKEVAPAVISLVTAMLLIWRGLTTEPAPAAGYSFLIVLVFTTAGAIADYCWGRTMRWGSRERTEL